MLSTFLVFQTDQPISHPAPLALQYITGTFLGAVDESGEPLGYPPVHLHHMHLGVARRVGGGDDAAGGKARLVGTE